MIVKGIELMQMIADGKIKDRKIITRHRSTGDIVNYIFEDNEIKLLDSKKPSIFDVLGLITILTSDFEILEDKTDEIECINAYNLIEAPYMAKCLDENNHTEFMELLKQSELELVDKIEKLTKTVNKLNKQDTSKETNYMSD